MFKTLYHFLHNSSFQSRYSADPFEYSNTISAHHLRGYYHGTVISELYSKFYIFIKITQFSEKISFFFFKVSSKSVKWM